MLFNMVATLYEDDATVAAWVYDGIISSGVNRWGRDVHCIVSVLESATTRCDSVITCSGGGPGCTVLIRTPKASGQPVT